MKPILILDTNIIYSALNERDANHAESLNILEYAYQNCTFEVPMICAMEYLIAVENINQGLMELRTFSPEFEQVSHIDLEHFAMLDVRKRKSLKSNDTALLTITKRLNAKLLTFDKKLYKVAKKLDLHFDYSDIVSPQSITN